MNRQNRRSIRLKGYDYGQTGAYFITVCAYNRECFFGEIVDGKMALNDCGNTTALCWREIPNHFPHVELDEFIVMSNHLHGILIINNSVGAKNFSPLQISVTTPVQSQRHPSGTSKTIGSIIRGFKIGVTKWFRKKTDVHHVWQRNYYEHIIRGEDDLSRIREYIINNPAQWPNDQNNPENKNRQKSARDEALDL